MKNSYRDQNNEYVPPRNAVTELFLSAPENLRSVFMEVSKEAEKANPAGEWPAVPYHYGMGRIQAYEEWLATLDEEELAAQIALSRETYETYYEGLASQIVSKLAERGIDLSPHIAERKAKQENDARLQRLRSRSRARDSFGPTLGGGRDR